MIQAVAFCPPAVVGTGVVLAMVDSHSHVSNTVSSLVLLEPILANALVIFVA